jgi:hypothetical protein
MDISKSLLRAGKTRVRDTRSEHFQNQMFILTHKCNLSRIKGAFYIFVKPENISGCMNIPRVEIKQTDWGGCMRRPKVRINNFNLWRLLPQNLAETLIWKTLISHWSLLRLRRVVLWIVRLAKNLVWIRLGCKCTTKSTGDLCQVREIKIRCCWVRVRFCGVRRRCFYTLMYCHSVERFGVGNYSSSYQPLLIVWFKMFPEVLCLACLPTRSPSNSTPMLTAAAGWIMYTCHTVWFELSYGPAVEPCSIYTLTGTEQAYTRFVDTVCIDIYGKKFCSGFVGVVVN